MWRESRETQGRSREEEEEEEEEGNEEEALNRQAAVCGHVRESVEQEEERKEARRGGRGAKRKEGRKEEKGGGGGGLGTGSGQRSRKPTHACRGVSHLFLLVFVFQMHFFPVVAWLARLKTRQLSLAVMGPRWNVGGRGPAGPLRGPRRVRPAALVGVPVGPACHDWWKGKRVEREGSRRCTAEYIRWREGKELRGWCPGPEGEGGQEDHGYMQKDLKISQRTTRQPLSLRDINLLFLEKISRECECFSLFFFFCIFVSNFGEVRFTLWRK